MTIPPFLSAVQPLLETNTSMETVNIPNSKSLPSSSSHSSSRPVRSLALFPPYSLSPSLTADVIAGASLVYDVLLVSTVLSIFFLPILRRYLEFRERQKVYQRYINAARPPTQDSAPKKEPLKDPSWQLWSAHLEDGLEFREVHELLAAPRILHT
jgi:hypothetical protein